MTTTDPVEMIKEAVAKGELVKLLLGEPGYCYLPKGSPAPGNTDLAAVIGVLYDFMPEADRPRVRDEMVKALSTIVSRYEGLEPVASSILLESLRKMRNRTPFGLPLDDLAVKLRESINAFADRLREDRSGIGASWADGRLGELRRLSRNTVDLGGPSFCK
jgi:hypothetical protein